MDLAYVESLRLAELEAVVAELEAALPPGARVLEVGAGSGWQARALAARGFVVDAVDVPGSSYAKARVWPVREYDGSALPFPDASFDAVFSSNVLEHVDRPDRLQRELLRVLRPGGVAIHVVPSAAWRFWTMATHYPFVALQARTLLLGRPPRRPGGEAEAEELRRRVGELSAGSLARKALLPSRHGARGSAAGELVAFSAARWRRFFEGSGWRVERRAPGGIFYTGNMVLGAALPLARRRTLSRLAGSACHLFVLRKAGPGGR